MWGCPDSVIAQPPALNPSHLSSESGSRISTYPATLRQQGATTAHCENHLLSQILILVHGVRYARTPRQPLTGRCASGTSGILGRPHPGCEGRRENSLFGNSVSGLSGTSPPG